MFGDLMGMMGKLKETQKKVEETKKRLDTVLIDESSSDKKRATQVNESEIAAVAKDGMPNIPGMDMFK